MYIKCYKVNHMSIMGGYSVLQSWSNCSLYFVLILLKGLMQRSLVPILEFFHLCVLSVHWKLRQQRTLKLLSPTESLLQGTHGLL